MRITDKARPHVKLCFTSISVAIRPCRSDRRQQLKRRFEAVVSTPSHLSVTDFSEMYPGLKALDPGIDLEL
jgi:hypothetical protein